MSDYYVARFHDGTCYRIAVARRGRTNLHLCIQDHPVTVVTVPLTEERGVTKLDYPVARAARKMLAFGKHGNATKAAINHLKGALE